MRTRWLQCYPFEDKKQEWRGKINLITKRNSNKSKHFLLGMDMNSNKIIVIGLIGSIMLLTIQSCEKANPISNRDKNTVTDIDGNVYQTIKIGNQIWTMENLRVTNYNDGTPIPKLTESAAWSHIFDSSLTTPAYSFYNNTINIDSIKKYGALYNWYVISPDNPKKIAPAGWHVPSVPEWDTLHNFLIANGYNWDGTRDSTHYDNKISSSLSAKTDWPVCSIPGAPGNDLTKNNLSGFTAFPGGARHKNGDFVNMGYNGYWWSTTGSNFQEALGWELKWDTDGVNNRFGLCSYGFSVRLVRD